MQFILLAAGKGQRLNSKLTNKCFTTICGKRLLDYNLELISSRIFDELIVVVGYNAKYIRKYVDENFHLIPVKYVYQDKILGIAHAMKMVKPYIYGDFVMCLSDEILLKPQIDHMENFFTSSNSDCVCGVVKDSLANIKKSYTLKIADDNEILYLIEKPIDVFNNWKGTGFCMMRPSMLSILENLEPNKIRKEYEMGDWIQLGIEKGLTCKIFNIAQKEFNINEKIDIRKAELYITNARGEKHS